MRETDAVDIAAECQMLADDHGFDIQPRARSALSQAAEALVALAGQPGAEALAPTPGEQMLTPSATPDGELIERVKRGLQIAQILSGDVPITVAARRELAEAFEAANALARSSAGEGIKFVAHVGGGPDVEKPIDSVAELLRLINGGARFRSIRQVGVELDTEWDEPASSQDQTS